MTTEAGPEGSEAEALPAWIVVPLVGALAALVGFGTVGLVLAIVGVMAPVPTLALGLVATVGLLVAVAPWRFATATDRSVQLPAALAVAVVAGATAYAVHHRAQHVLLDRDPGSYILTGRWLATHHNLEFTARVGAFTHATGLRYGSPAVFDRGGGRLYFQFSHLLPVLLAQARWLGGDRLMFVAPMLLGGLGLMSFYALATRFVRPWVALAALTALAADLVELHFMRDAYSELPTQAVLLGGLWLLTRRAPPRPAVAAFTGLLLGATVMARIDGPLYLVAIPFVVGAAVLARREDPVRGRAALVATAWLLAAIVVAITIGLTDVSVRSPKYLHDLGGRVVLQYVGLILLCVLASAFARFAPRLVAWPARAVRGRVPDIAALVVGAGLFGAWFVRPHLQTTHGAAHPYIASLERIDHTTVDSTRRYFENSLVWHSWYLGVVALAAGIVGAALLTRAVVRGTFGTRGLVVATFLPVAVVYLVNPSIFPDQIWVMRRFLPLVIPGFVLAAFVFVDLLLTARAISARYGLRVVARVAGVAIVVAAIAWPIHTDWSVRGDTTQAGYLGPLEQLCHALGPHAAVVVLQGNALHGQLPQALRSYCDLPVAVRIDVPGVTPIDRAGMTRLASDWRRDGRTLFLVADTPDRIRHILPAAEPSAPITAYNGLFLSEHILERPGGYQPMAATFSIAPVPLP